MHALTAQGASTPRWQAHIRVDVWSAYDPSALHLQVVGELRGGRRCRRVHSLALGIVALCGCLLLPHAYHLQL
jgi:hypothetical protein